MSMDDPNEELEPTVYEAVEKYRERLKDFKPTLGLMLHDLPDDIPEVHGMPHDRMTELMGVFKDIPEDADVTLGSGPPVMETAGCEHDYPDLDATDGAHAAWWRGHDHTTMVFCRMVNDILDGKDTGSGSGYEPWESTRRRLLELVTKR